VPEYIRVNFKIGSLDYLVFREKKDQEQIKKYESSLYRR